MNDNERINVMKKVGQAGIEFTTPRNRGERSTTEAQRTIIADSKFSNTELIHKASKTYDTFKTLSSTYSIVLYRPTYRT